MVFRHLPTLLLALSCCAEAAEIAPFTSDGCSAFPDGTIKQEALWLACCRAHDYAYWKGGSYEDRVAADDALKACVASTGEEEIANLMLAGVRIGGSPYLPTNFRWGYGWPMGRGYKPLTPAEQEAIRHSEAVSSQDSITYEQTGNE
ncbi:FAD-binding oxidoreductase [Microbulbifer salipaludis]|uniref:FAD-binding oxidoreductase n=1 Tax=Microbulbifer salipaludis TaxID=187980 RepID=A0ABS3E532_9GAMM|nr:FAD-binding oxidoreductase [Microbulbifer salipaludis]MBN8430413.1 FAD-binding oxidoreductase [Microbulbifer salipaludis]